MSVELVSDRNVTDIAKALFAVVPADATLETHWPEAVAVLSRYGFRPNRGRSERSSGCKAQIESRFFIACDGNYSVSLHSRCPIWTFIHGNDFWSVGKLRDGNVVNIREWNAAHAKR